MDYIFDEENEPEQVKEQELCRLVQALRPIDSNIAVSFLGRAMDVLQRKWEELFAIYRSKDP